MRKMALSLMSAFLLEAPAQAAPPFPPATPAEHIVLATAVPDYITMDADSALYTLEWLGQPDKVLLRWKLMALDGEIIVCANYALIGHSNRSLSRKALRDMSVMMDGRLLVERANVFNEVGDPEALIGSRAKCIRTGVAAPRDPGAHSFGIGHPKPRYRN